MRKRSIKNRTQLMFLLFLVALLNLAQTPEECKCKLDEDGVEEPVLKEICLSASPPSRTVTDNPNEVSYVYFAYCGDMQGKPLVPTLDSGPGLYFSYSSNEQVSFEVQYAAKSSPSDVEGFNFNSWADQGHLYTYVVASVEKGPFTSGGSAMHSIKMLPNPETAPPWARGELRFKGPAIATPRSLNFNETPVGSSSGCEVAIQNKGDADLVASFAVDPNDGNFLPPFQIVVPPHGELSRVVIFGPISSGTKFATLVVTSNDPMYPSVGIPMRARGYIP
ncbi:MAG: hypothetical protein EHM18_08170 [Acidobacteria bacterium]|nr:MAG: hypothetical protein EHM18_08170 [Acidobacteriota bacterium]